MQLLTDAWHSVIGDVGVDVVVGEVAGVSVVAGVVVIAGVSVVAGVVVFFVYVDGGGVAIVGVLLLLAVLLLF